MRDATRRVKGRRGRAGGGGDVAPARLRHALAIGFGLLVAAGCGSESEADAKAGFVVLVDADATGHEASGPPLPSPALWETPLAEAELERGRRVWAGTCIQCHSTGLGGAPLIGNRDMWSPRLEQGLDVLFRHALNGFYGNGGEMPARGGNPELSDDEVRAAVRFMTSKATASG